MLPSAVAVADWLEKDGVLAVFNVLGKCFIAVCELTIPLWIIGKRARSVIARNRISNKFMRANRRPKRCRKRCTRREAVSKY